jgi:hypothetical protein
MRLKPYFILVIGVCIANALVIQQSIRKFDDDTFKIEELTQEKFDQDQRLVSIFDSEGQVAQKHFVVQAPKDVLNLLPYLNKFGAYDGEISKNIRDLSKFEVKQFALGIENKSIFQSNDGSRTTIQLPFSAKVYYEGTFLRIIFGDTLSIHGVFKIEAPVCLLDDQTVSCAKSKKGVYGFIIGGSGYDHIKVTINKVIIPTLIEKYRDEIMQAATRVTETKKIPES